MFVKLMQLSLSFGVSLVGLVAVIPIILGKPCIPHIPDDVVREV